AVLRPSGRGLSPHVAAGGASSRRSDAVDGLVVRGQGVGVVRIAVIGAGRGRTAFAVLLGRAGHEIVAVAGRGATAERAAAWLPGVPIFPPAEAAALGDLVLLGVPDNVLGSIVAELTAAEAVAAGTWVTHVSGATGLEVLSPLRERGARG